jgi:hypothetical protein
MKRIFYFSFLLFFANLSFGQSSLDLKEIERLTNDSTSDYFYPRLISDFNNQPQYFDSVKAKFLYYGKLFTKSYKMFQFSIDEIEFNKLLSKGKYKKATPIGEKILHENPANIEITSKLNLCYKKIGLKENADTTLNKLTLLLNTVFQSGTGKEKENAFKVVAIGDEYAIMAWLGVIGISRESLMNGGSTIDSWKVKESKSGEKYEMHFEWLVNAKQGTKNMKWPE